MKELLYGLIQVDITDNAFISAYCLSNITIGISGEKSIGRYIDEPESKEMKSEGFDKPIAVGDDDKVKGDTGIIVIKDDGEIDFDALCNYLVDDIKDRIRLERRFFIDNADGSILKRTSKRSSFMIHYINHEKLEFNTIVDVDDAMIVPTPYYMTMKVNGQTERTIIFDKKTLEMLADKLDDDDPAKLEIMLMID